MNTQSKDIIVIFSEDYVDREYIAETIAEIFNDTLQIIILGGSDLKTAKDKYIPKAVVATESTIESAPTHFPNSKVIYAKRTVTGQNLEDVIMLPANTSVIVANSPHDTALETVKQLHSFGIDYLNLIPYWPGSTIDCSLYDIVIYPGILDFCPPNMKKYINIGNRNLAISVIMKIVETYNLHEDYVDDIHEKYIRLAIQNSLSLDSILHEVQHLKKNLEYVSNLSSSAIITIDNYNLISLINPVAEHFLEVEHDNCLGKDYRECFDIFPELLEIIDQNKNINEYLLRINHKPALTTIQKISIEENLHTLVNITPVETLRNSEIKIRTNLYKHGFTAKYTFEDIKGESDIINEAKSIAQEFSNSDATILITGQSGTGKELFAQAIHNNSSRKKSQFVGINFAALPESIAESELFGYEEGAFTGAVKGGKIGLFEVAHNGTIFLDEIGDASLAMQVRLLRVFEEREIVRIGSSQVIPIDIRIICATNKNLKQMVKEDKFREDLFYRIRVLPLNIPSLSERKSDIPIIINHLCEQYHVKTKIPNSLLNEFIKHDWPGNIRELKSIIQYLSALKKFDEEKLLKLLMHNQLSHNSYNESQNYLSDDLITILKEIKISNSNGITAGRYSLSKSNKLQEINLTEGKIKNRLKKLENSGFITTGKTKQGVVLTEKGMNILTINESSAD